MGVVESKEGVLLTSTGFIRGILRGVRYAKSLRVLFLHRRSPSWTTLVLYSRVVFIFNEPTIHVMSNCPYGAQWFPTSTGQYEYSSGDLKKHVLLVFTL